MHRTPRPVGTRSGDRGLRPPSPFVALGLALLLTASCSSTPTAAPPGTSSASSNPTVTGAPTVSGATGSTAGAGTTDLPEGYDGYRSELYVGVEHWLCHPEVADDVCDRDLDATVLEGGALGAVEPHEVAADPGVDCFYVYPTISGDPGLNSDLEPAEDQEVRATVNQVARLDAVCDVYVPVYRQRTISSLLQRISGEEVDTAAMDRASEVAYGDVLDAWKQYIANDNHGRGVILVGHSQGAGWLNKLVAEEIDDEPLLRDRMVAAYLIGTTLSVAPGSDVGGSFDHIPLCRRTDQTGCVVTYASFAASSPPPADSLFGRLGGASDEEGAPGEVVACTNPAALDGGSGELVAYFRGPEAARLLAAAGVTEPIATDWLVLRNALAAACTEAGGFTFLQVTLGGDPTDVRDRQFAGGLPPDWGLHLADVNLAMGNLVDLARRQAEAYGPGTPGGS